jgi:hypothetical protein
LLNPARPLRLDGDVLVVEVQSEFHRSTMSQERNRALLADAIDATLGIRPGLSFEAARSTPGAAPDVADLADTTPLQAAAHDPVELVKQGFGAEVVEETDSSGARDEGRA